MKKIVLLLAVLAIALSACVRSEDVTLTGVSDYQLRLPSAVSFSVGIENRSAHKLRLLACNVELSYQGRKVMAAVLREPVSVERHFMGRVPVDFRLRLTDPLAGMAALGSMQGSMDGVTVSGEAVIKAGWGRKKIQIENEPLSQFIANFGLEL